ncbi:TPA: hypothetical protein ACGEPX_002889 [Salmonella enterica]|nr:hypothetical protein [Salmonella enterica]EBV5751958.1 hypothetical protein [Salmonella enterica subsp. enterica serovar Inverness]ECM3645700.1 hypothetical protein [Salmonella enterica subsp. enterica serovar Typhimurium]EDM4062532.1 hypothetical protein [Salmonella enterica subsp. houtenae serovar Houten]EDP9265953.1 hypothetical protein [Salmonella enterica subsp. houtenae]EDQ4518953.1 hypothetical protein [Salmonella enterica subsp. enterica]
MSEFSNRIKAQREALKVVNGSGQFREPLLSLTEKAIERWSNNNNLSNADHAALLLKEMSGTLFFLANKSQEQVTEDYKILSKKVSDQLSKLEIELQNRVVPKTIR